MDDSSVGFDVHFLQDDRPLRLRGLRITVRAGEDEQSLIFPRLADTDHAQRLAWTVGIRSSSDRSLLQLTRLGRFVQLLQGSDVQVFDLQDSNSLNLTIQLGHGFSILTAGDSYGYLLLFRLIQCNQSQIRLRLLLSSGRLDVFTDANLPIEATFFIRPALRKDAQFLAGVPSISRRLSNVACVINEPFAPRFFLDVASGILAVSDIPLSMRPQLGAPRSSFPLIVVGIGDKAIWLNAGPISQQVVTETITCIVYFGHVSKAAIDEAIQSINIRTIGIISESQKEVDNILQDIGIDSKTITSGTALFKEYREKIVGILVSENILESWHQLDSFLTQLNYRSIADMPAAFLVSWKEHMDARLPALPYCRDLAVSMSLSVANRQRGRCMPDSGADALTYDQLADENVWLVRGQRLVISDRDQLLLEIGLRAASEYLAIQSYLNLLDFTQRSLPDDDKQGPADLSSLDAEATAYVSAWQRGAVNNRGQFTSVASPLARRLRVAKARDWRVLSSIASAFLATYQKRLSEDGSENEDQAAINPLVLVLASGGQEEYDLNLDLAATYWSAYAAGYSGSKPGVIVPTLIRRQEIAEALRRQAAIRIAVQLMPEPTSDVHLLDLRSKRRAFGQLVSSKLSPAALGMLKAANADRIVAFSSLNLDFVPFETSILGLERPLTRFPVASEMGADVLLVNCVSISAAVSDTQGRAAILFPSNPSDEAGEWAKRLGSSIAQLTSLWGFSGETVGPADPDSSVLKIVEASELVLFVGHATADESGVIDLGHLQITFEQLRKIEWTGKIAFFIGCETSVVDLPTNDLGALLLEKGALAVLGTTAEVTFEVAHTFLRSFLSDASSGLPLDYAFFAARRESVIAEALFHTGMEWRSAIERASEIVQSSAPMAKFSTLLNEAGITWDDAYAAAVFSLSLTMAGGAGVRLQ